MCQIVCQTNDLINNHFLCCCDVIGANTHLSAVESRIVRAEVGAPPRIFQRQHCKVCGVQPIPCPALRLRRRYAAQQRFQSADQHKPQLDTLQATLQQLLQV